MGKSTILAIKAVHHIWTKPASLVLVSSPSLRQSAEFLAKARQFVRALGLRPQGDGANRHSILLPNHSRIVGLPASDATVRGFSAVSLLLIDEASRVPDVLYHALRPTLAASAKQGQLWLTSTPFGKRGFFYDEWANGHNWERFTARADECDRIDPEFLEEERRVHGDAVFAQEYLCEFTGASQSLFPLELIESAVRDEIETLF